MRFPGFFWESIQDFQDIAFVLTNISEIDIDLFARQG